jgi:hypothetical protein
MYYTTTSTSTGDYTTWQNLYLSSSPTSEEWFTTTNGDPNTLTTFITSPTYTWTSTGTATGHEALAKISEQIDRIVQTIRRIDAALPKVKEDEVPILERWRKRLVRRLLAVTEDLAILAQKQYGAERQSAELPLEPDEPEIDRLHQGLGLD